VKSHVVVVMQRTPVWHALNQTQFFGGLHPPGLAEPFARDLPSAATDTHSSCRQVCRPQRCVRKCSSHKCDAVCSAM
jgi:hypothetical protein